MARATYYLDGILDNGVMKGKQGLRREQSARVATTESGQVN